MAKVTTYISDFSGEQVDGVEQVEFSLNGERFKMDMSPSERAELAEVMAVYVEAGRKLKGQNGAKPVEVGDDPKAMRASLRAHGFTVSDRGQLSAEHKEAYAKIKADQNAA